MEEPLSLPKAPLISPDNPGHSVVQFDQEGNAATTTTTTRGGYHSDGHGGHGGHGHGHSLQLQKLSPFRHTQDSGYQGSEYVQRMGNQGGDSIRLRNRPKIRPKYHPKLLYKQLEELFFQL